MSRTPRAAALWLTALVALGLVFLGSNGSARVHAWTQRPTAGCDLCRDQGGGTFPNGAHLYLHHPYPLREEGSQGEGRHVVSSSAAVPIGKASRPSLQPLLWLVVGAVIWLVGGSLLILYLTGRRARRTRRRR
jgi:hypothetical protein